MLSFKNYKDLISMIWPRLEAPETDRFASQRPLAWLWKPNKQTRVYLSIPNGVDKSLSVLRVRHLNQVLTPQQWGSPPPTPHPLRGPCVAPQMLSSAPPLPSSSGRSRSAHKRTKRGRTVRPGERQTRTELPSIYVFTVKNAPAAARFPALWRFTEVSSHSTFSVKITGDPLMFHRKSVILSVEFMPIMTSLAL